jgi:Calcineurin-like phosphoesterase
MPGAAKKVLQAWLCNGKDAVTPSAPSVEEAPVMIRSLAAVAAVVTLCIVPATAAGADQGNARKGAFTLAVFGDEPYGTVQGDHAQLDATPAFIDSMNADPDVSTVIHLGDIHSGKQWCTQPYDQSIADLWTRFTDPLVYTPGDNEWSDCHKPG